MTIHIISIAISISTPQLCTLHSGLISNFIHYIIVQPQTYTGPGSSERPHTIWQILPTSPALNRLAFCIIDPYTQRLRTICEYRVAGLGLTIHRAMWRMQAQVGSVYLLSSILWNSAKYIMYMQIMVEYEDPLLLWRGNCVYVLCVWFGSLLI